MSLFNRKSEIVRSSQLAASLGSSEGSKELETIVDKINPTIHDFLMKLPGINSKNIHTLMRRVTNMKALLKLTEVIFGLKLISVALPPFHDMRCIT